MSAPAKKQSANRPLTHWLAHWEPTSIIAIDADGQEHPIVVTKQKRKWDIAAKAVLEVDAVTVRAMSDAGLLATRTLRTVEAGPVEEETQATPATPGGYDVTAVVQCVAKEVREAVTEAFRAAQGMHATTTSELVMMVKQLGERHSQAEKALLEAREQIIIEREERIAEREAAAEQAAERAEQEEKKEQIDLVKHVLGLAAQNPGLVKEFMGSMNGKAAKTIAVAATPAPTPPKVDP